MASTQKTPPKRAATSKPKSQADKKPAAKKKKGSSFLWQQRLAAGTLCFLLSMFLILNIFHVEALVVDLLASSVKGVIGYGFWLMVPALLMSAYLFLLQTKEPITLRIWCTLLLPILFGTVIHIFVDSDMYPFSLQGIQQLWWEGQLLQCGGALSGFLAILFSQLFSGIGASVMFLSLMLVLFLVAFRLTPEIILAALRQSLARYRNHRARKNETFYDEDFYEDDDYQYYADEPPYEAAPTPAALRPRRQALDLPLDEPPLLNPMQDKQGRRGLFNKTPQVKRPDEVLADLTQSEAATLNTEAPQPDIQLAPEPTPLAEPVPTPPPSRAVPEPLVERELTKSEKKEIIREHQEAVAKDVASILEASVPNEYQYPPLHLLHEATNPSQGAVQDELTAIQKRLSDTISSFGIVATITGAVRGPSITRYEVELDQGVRLNKLTNLSDDIALSLGASSVRIAPVPGKISLVGIEVPNQKITPVPIREVISSERFTENASKVSFAVGKDIGGNYIIGDIAKLPHMLIAGTTGSGKSVCTNSLIISMLYKSTPEEVRLIMVDPKMVELGIYNGIPHLLIPVVTDPKKAAGALQWAVSEMMKRYRMFAEVGVRDLSSYNAYAARTGSMQKLPQIVVVIDELADLMLVAAKEVEESICRVAQMGRASGMHLVIATQRPSADVITGLMKANIPSRIAFAVASSLESRIILDTQGAEKLVGKGDMLWFPLGSGKPLRVQGCLIDDADVAAVVSFVKASGDAAYDEAVLHEIEQHAEEHTKGSKSAAADPLSEGENSDLDDLFPDAVEIVLELGQASVSMLQRRLKLGYSRAARLVDQMEDRGIVGPFEGSKPRQLLLSRDQWHEMSGRKRVLDEDLPSPAPDIAEADEAATISADADEVSSPPPWEDEAP